jgi:hypothetical protein
MAPAAAAVNGVARASAGRLVDGRLLLDVVVFVLLSKTAALSCRPQPVPLLVNFLGAAPLPPSICICLHPSLKCCTFCDARECLDSTLCPEKKNQAPSSCPNPPPTLHHRRQHPQNEGTPGYYRAWMHFAFCISNAAEERKSMSLLVLAVHRRGCMSRPTFAIQPPTPLFSRARRRLVSCAMVCCARLNVVAGLLVLNLVVTPFQEVFDWSKVRASQGQSVGSQVKVIGKRLFSAHRCNNGGGRMM